VYINQYLAWFLRMKRPGHDLSWHAIRRRRFHENNPTPTHRPLVTPLLENSSKSLLANITNTDDQTYIRMTNTQLIEPIMNHMKSSIRTDVYDMNSSRSDIRMILSELKFITDYVRREDEEDDISQDWKFSAMVIDRLCLVVFTILTTIFSYVTLFAAPNFFKLR
jgi:nicotinic acetylcholine receptor